MYTTSKNDVSQAFFQTKNRQFNKPLKTKVINLPFLFPMHNVLYLHHKNNKNILYIIFQYIIFQ
ncbi:hypothetical protein F528_2471 [Neisseria meningitidis 992008]|nr:hypothetical protein F528_2471 [Neisseria meningitidis 992008]